MERPTLTSLAWSDTGELSNEARATQETIERLRQFDGEVILTREEITRVYQFKADEIRQYQEWLQSPVLSNEDKIQSTSASSRLSRRSSASSPWSQPTTALRPSVFEVWDRHRQEVVGLATTKHGAIALAPPLGHFPRRQVNDLVIRPKSEPPLRIYRTAIQPKRSKSRWSVHIVSHR